MPRSCKRRHGCKLVCHFLENSCSLSSPGSALLVRCVEGDCVPVLQTPLVHSAFCTSSGWCPPTTAVLCLEGPAGPAWRREGGPSVPSPATWLPRGEGGVEGGGAEEAGQREKESFSLLFFSLVFFSFSGLLFSHSLLSSSFLLSHFVHVSHEHRSHYNLGAHRTYWLTLSHPNPQRLYFYIHHFFCH